jgi:hypothetical protein
LPLSKVVTDLEQIGNHLAALAEHPSLPGNAERESAVTVAQLTQYMKINLDYLSPREGGEDLGPNVG